MGIKAARFILSWGPLKSRGTGIDVITIGHTIPIDVAMRRKPIDRQVGRTCWVNSVNEKFVVRRIALVIGILWIDQA